MCPFAYETAVAPRTRCSCVATGEHGSLERKPSGIPVAVVGDPLPRIETSAPHGTALSTG